MENKGGRKCFIPGWRGRGVIIPHQFVRSISDVFIISKSALPSQESGFEEVSEE